MEINNNKQIKKLLGIPDSIFIKFHSSTKIKKFTNNVKTSNSKTSENIQYKAYARFKEIKLPPPKLNKNISLYSTLINRKSSRIFSSSKLSIKTISTLLYFSAGLKVNKFPIFFKRFYPSAGAKYPLEIYTISLNTELPQGIYHYYLKSHRLEKLWLIKNKHEVINCFNQKWINDCALLILITAIFKRTIIKYGDRGYRYILIEAGHLAQNIYLLSSALELSCCAIGGFLDDKLNQLIDIDGLNESLIYVLAVGKLTDSATF